MDHQMVQQRFAALTTAHYERLCATSETWIYLTMIRLMLRRLARMQ